MRKILPFVFALVMGALLFSGCKNEDDKGFLVGTWKSSYDETWTITTTTVTTDNYAGTIENSPNFEAPAGVIIIKYTTKPQYLNYDENWKVVGDPVDPPGDYYAVYWKDLTVNSVELANAWDVNDFTPEGAPETETLAGAKQKFTLNTADQFVGAYSSCEKQ